MSSPRLSVIVLTHQRPDRVARLLGDLALQTLPPDQYEVLVTEDGASDASRAALLAIAPSCVSRVLSLRHLGPAHARNQALEHVRAPLVLFLNDDTRAPAHLLEAHLEAHAAAPHPVAVLGGFSFPDDVRADLLTRLLEDLQLVITTRTFEHGGLYSSRAFWTGNLSVSTAQVRAVGGFDERFTQPSYEDLELGHRLERRFGLPVLHWATAGVAHHHPQTLDSWRRQALMGGTWAFRMHQLHGTQSLEALEVDGQLCPTRVRDYLGEIQAMEAGIEQLSGLIGQVLSAPSDRPIQGELRIDDRVFQLPADTEPLLVACLPRIADYDFKRAFFGAALQHLAASGGPARDHFAAAI